MAYTFKSSSPGASPRLTAALERLDRLIDWERRERGPVGRSAMRVSLAPAADLVARLGAPHERFRAIHVAGTKGKGSVAALIAAGLRRLGLAVGVYASPHVERINERVRIRDGWITDDELAAGLERAFEARAAAIARGSAARDATWFDMLTAAAFRAFADAEVDVAVVECGLGGRLDSTNVLPAGPSVITNIDFEHTAILGTTRAAIAAEKAGIVKPGSLVVSGVADDDAGAEIARAAQRSGATLVRVDTSPTQRIEERNRSLAGALLDALGSSSHGGAHSWGSGAGAGLLDEATCAAARLPGRMERIDVEGTPVILDGAHVPASVEAVLRDLRGDPELARPPVVILGLGRDKDASGILKILQGGVDRVLCTSTGSGSGRDSEELLGEAQRVGVAAETAAVPGDALPMALGSLPSDGWVLVTGSLHLVGTIRSRLRGQPLDRACSPSSPTCS